MATFCTKCGAGQSPDTQFCTACGAPLAAAAVAPAPTYSAPGGFAPGPYAQSAPPPPQKSGGALKIILIIVGVIVFLGIIAISFAGYAAYRIAHTIHVNGPNGDVTINTPNGSITANSSAEYSASDLGVDLYPGAKHISGGMKMDTPNGSMISAIYVTQDSKEQVLAFYKDKFGSGVTSMDFGNVASLTLKKSEDEVVQVTITTEESDKDGKTKFTILHTKKLK